MHTIRSVRIGPIPRGQNIIMTHEVPIDFNDEDLDDFMPLPSAPPDPYLNTSLLPSAPLLPNPDNLPIAVESDSENETQPVRIGTPICQTLTESMNNIIPNAHIINEQISNDEDVVSTDSELVTSYSQIRTVENFQIQELARRALIEAEERASRRIYLRDIIQYHIDSEKAKKQEYIDKMEQILKTKKEKSAEYQRAQNILLRQQKRDQIKKEHQEREMENLRKTMEVYKEEYENMKKYNKWRRNNPNVVKHNPKMYPESYRERREIINKEEERSKQIQFFHNVVEIEESQRLQKDIDKGFTKVMVKDGHYQNPEKPGYTATFRCVPIDINGDAIDEEDREIVKNTRYNTKRRSLDSYLLHSVKNYIR